MIVLAQAEARFDDPFVALGGNVGDRYFIMLRSPGRP
jgi:hypothetical protein